MATLEERVLALERLLSVSAGTEPYNSTFTGTQIDNAIARALPGGDFDKLLSEKAPAIESTDHPGCYYRTVGGVQEWISPPMLLGVEYRTTERYLGKPVYAKQVDCGQAPNNTLKTVQYSDDTSATPISAVGVAKSGSAQSLCNASIFGGNTTERNVFGVAVGLQKIYIVTNFDRSEWNVYVTVKYIRTTD